MKFFDNISYLIKKYFYRCYKTNKNTNYEETEIVLGEETIEFFPNIN